MAVDFGTRGRPRRRWIPLGISFIAVVGTLGAMAFTARDLLHFEQANAFLPSPGPVQAARFRPRAEGEWRQVHANLETRLHQTLPLELGAVWATRTGQICGLVNGRGSFGGLTSMTRFYTENRQPVFHQDADHLTFQNTWFQCLRDQYVTLHVGAYEPGFCGSAAGKRHCFNVVNGVRQDPAGD